VSIAAQIDRLLAGEDLGREGAAEALDAIMGGHVDPVQTGAFLIALRAKGETAAELAGLASVVRARSESVWLTSTPLVDTCGTGGGRSTFNVSTAAAFVVAGAGVAVAKHGNRSATSRSGSADVLEALGARIDLSPEAVAQCVERVGVGFMFAPSHHPAFRHIGPVRQALGVRTIFNLLGPLTNPAGVRRQVIGVSDPSYIERIATALGELGAEHALVVSSEDGLDEISTGAPTQVAEVTSTGVRMWRIDPVALGIAPAVEQDIAGGEPAENASIITAALERGEGAAADLIALNAAAAILVSGRATSLDDALTAARESITNGGARARLAQFVAVTNELAPERQGE
jgi:anthranilate phosphoribosyltransferase